jgi:hypothetical protein
MITVTLTPNEVHLAASHGLLRRYEKLQGKRGDRIQKERSNWDNEIEGACAELAWAKHLSVYWTGVSNLKAKDGADMEVRWTKHEGGGLIIYPHDDDQSVFVLAKGYAPEFRFVGWLRGGDGKRIGRETDFGFLVSASDLRSME